MGRVDGFDGDVRASGRDEPHRAHDRPAEDAESLAQARAEQALVDQEMAATEVEMARGDLLVEEDVDGGAAGPELS